MHSTVAQAQREEQDMSPKQNSSSAVSREALALAESQQGICRLCLEEECVSGLVSCCGCIGSIQYIHAQ